MGDVVALTNDAPGEGFIDIMLDLRDMALTSPKVHEIVGTEFDYRTMKCGNEEIENWLHHQLSDNASFEFSEGEIDGHRVVALAIRPAFAHTVDFEHVAYIRVGSYTKPLKSYPAVEAAVWNKITKSDFEAATALVDVSVSRVLQLLDCAKYFELLGMPFPQTQEEVVRYLGEDFLAERQWSFYNNKS